MNGTPEIAGYQFDQRLLAHPLAEIWRGRAFTGLEVIALVLSEAGAADPEVRSRLEQASRGIAFDSTELQTPLWAANLSGERPYAITQLVPGQSGAEQLLDPLDGILGNDADSLEAVRAQLAQYGTAPLPPGAAQDLPSYAPETSPAAPVQEPAGSTSTPPGSASTPPGSISTPAGSGTARSGQDAVAQGERSGIGVKIELVQEKLGGWIYLIAAVVVLFVFTVTYSVGAAIGSATKDREPEAPAAAPAASPSPYPTPAIKSAVPKPKTAPYRKPDGAPGLAGAAYPAGADVQLVDARLPFVFGWPRPPVVMDLGETSTTLYRRVRLTPVPEPSSLDAKLALRYCANLAACQSTRAAFEKDWTAKFKLPAPTNARRANTWVTIQQSRPYTLTMTRIFVSNGQWWLIGVGITAASGDEPTAQQILNDIYRQTV